MSRYPKSERFRLAKRIEDTGYEFYEKLIHVTRDTENAKEGLREADALLIKLKLYFRISKDRNFASQQQYQYAANALIEIGKLLGGWSKKVNG